MSVSPTVGGLQGFPNLLCRTTHTRGWAARSRPYPQYAPAVASDAGVAAQHLLEYGSRTALLVVDVQNDFADPSGALYVPGAGAVVDRANAEIASARAVGAKVIYTQDSHPPVTAHFKAHGGPWPEHCVRGTWGADFHPDLVLAGEVVP